jgi:hypothetical protein
MHQFAGQSPDDKIRFLFKVYDLDGESDCGRFSVTAVSFRRRFDPAQRAPARDEGLHGGERNAVQRGADRRLDGGDVRRRRLQQQGGHHLRGPQEPAGEARRLAGEPVDQVRGCGARGRI